MKNLEIKARFKWSYEVDDILEEINAKFETAEIQNDTYFNVNNGRIKIRERQGKDAQMIQYFRDDKADDFCRLLQRGEIRLEWRSS